jgi:hypothetical protein
MVKIEIASSDSIVYSSTGIRSQCERVTQLSALDGVNSKLRFWYLSNALLSVSLDVVPTHLHGALERVIEAK